jgi:hypothetical protein
MNKPAHPILTIGAMANRFQAISQASMMRPIAIATA